MKTTNDINRFTEECKILCDIGEHQNIIQCFGALIDNTIGEGRLMTELAHSKLLDGDLSQLLVDEDTEEAPLSLDQSLYYLQQILSAVHHLHSHNVLHLDLKCKL